MELLPLLVMVISLDAVWGLKCYSCSYSKDTDMEDTCVKKPQQMTNPTAACSKGNCYIKRIQFTDGGKVSSFSRGCIDTLKTGKTVNTDYTIYTRTCTASLCNDWDGIRDKYGKGDDGDMDGVIIYAPGVGDKSGARGLLAAPAVLLVIAVAAP